LVISRSVTITLITTKELVLKDFAFDPDEKKLIRGATLVVQNLAGNLALVTSRDPLKMAFQQNLKANLDSYDNITEEAKELIVNTTSLDNLDLGCALIKKAVIEKALDDVNQDTTLHEAIEKRRMARERGIPFFDENAANIYQNLPEPLRHSSKGLTPEQMRIYEDFGKVVRVIPMNRRIGVRTGRVLDPDSVEVIQRFEQCKPILIFF
jgi:CCR4-NOT transcription complex subunit 1